VSAWAAVLQDIGVRGGTPAQIATRLGLSADLVQAILDHAERLGVLTLASYCCGAGCPTGAELPPVCAGCLLTLA
jgi:hypothetical protein